MKILTETIDKINNLFEEKTSTTVDIKDKGDMKIYAFETTFTDESFKGMSVVLGGMINQIDKIVEGFKGIDVAKYKEAHLMNLHKSETGIV